MERAPTASSQPAYASYFSNSNKSPTSVPVFAAIPIGNSSTECAIKLADIRLRIPDGNIPALTFKTFRFLSRNNTSIANFIPNMWMPSQGTIHNPSPSASPLCCNNPVRRF